MLSKIFGFLNELFTRSRTKQWERVLGKQLQIVDSVERRAPSKKSTRTFAYSSSRLQRTPLPMLVPQNSILFWKESIDPNDAGKPQTLSLLFGFPHNDSALVVALRRPVTEPFAETAKRIEAKIRKLASPQKSRKSSVAPTIEQSNGGIMVSVEAPDSPAQGSLTVEDVMTAQRDLIIGGHLYSIIREPPDIASLTCALKPIVGCPLYPAVDFRQGLADNLPVFHWYIYTRQLEESSNGKSKESGSKETIKLLEGPSRNFVVSNCEYRWTGKSYVPSPVDTGKRLLVVADLGPHAIVKCGLSKFAIETVGEPLLCEENIKWCEEERPAACLRIVSYNILADLYLDLSGPQESLYFPYCPKAYQMYEYRYPLVLKELLSYDMDLCFLQEVDHRMQMRYLSSLFQSIDLEMYFSKKEKEVTEGSVIAYRRQRFEVLSSECHGIASLMESSGSDIKNILGSSAEALEIFTSRPTTIQVLVLLDRVSEEFIICGNTHLHHNPKHEHLKVLQATIAVRILERIRNHLSKQNPDSSVRLLLAGDFNSGPDGPVYELLSTGFLPKTSSCWKMDEKIVPEDLYLLPSHATLKNLTGTQATNFTRFNDDCGCEHGYVGCLDYIWTDSAQLHRLAPRPSQKLLEKYQALPSKIAPSDHVPLLCEVFFRKE